MTRGSRFKTTMHVERRLPRGGGGRISFLGVFFRWPDLPEAAIGRLGRDIGGVVDLVEACAAPFIRRQRRTAIAYWDALTFLQGQGAGLIANRFPEWSITLGLLSDMAEGEPTLETVADLLNATPALNGARSYLAVVHADEAGRSTAIERLANRRVSPARVKALGPSILGVREYFELDAEEVLGPPETADVLRMLVIAVLLNLRDDLAVYYKTGFHRVRRCARRECMAWFAARPMASSRQRFCSNVCRASAPREQ